MRPGFVLRAVAVTATAAVVVLVSASDDGIARRRQPRMSAEEREEVLRRLQRDVPCVPPETPPTTTKPLPPLPHSFTTELELTHQEEGKQKVVYGAEAFDMVFNMGILRYELGEGIADSRPYDKQEIIHYSIGTDEVLIITTNTACEDEGAANCDPKKDCNAKKLTALHKEMRDLFGLGEADGNSGYFGISGILQWAMELNYEYRGRDLCRGMQCDLYEICMKNEKEGSIALISYYWSLADWSVDSNTGQVPLAIEVVSNGIFSPYFTRSVKQRYDFYEFYSNVRPDADILEPPADVYCKSRVNKNEHPKAPFYFSYNSEAVTPITLSFPAGENQTQDVEFTVAFSYLEYYDWVSKVTMADFVPWYLFGQENRYEYETRRIQDFNQGITYNVYKHLESCEMHPIENTTSAGDVVVSDNGTVSILPPWMFEDLDGPWQYNGIHMMRGVEADVWVGQKNLLSIFLHENYVHYYASPLVIDEPIFRDSSTRAAREARRVRTRQARGNGKSGTAWGKIFKDNPSYVSTDTVPLRLETYLNLVAGKPHLLSNIYDYQTQPPLTHTLDVSLCYAGSKKRDFLLELPSDSLKQVNDLEDNLLHATQQALAEVAVISPLRINRAMMEFRGAKTYVLFTILALPSVEGDAPGAMLESDLNTAVHLITSAVSNSDLIIIVHLEGTTSSGQPVYVALQTRSIKEVERNEDNTYSFTTDQGYGPGDMAGLAIGLLVVGVLVGVVVCMAVQRRARSQGGLPRVTMARKSLSPSNTINISSDITVSDI